MALLALEKVSKAFPGVRALHDVSLKVEAGEIHALLGENGAGKSTLMKILCGIHQPDSGRMLGILGQLRSCWPMSHCTLFDRYAHISSGLTAAIDDSVMAPCLMERFRAGCHCRRARFWARWRAAMLLAIYIGRGRNA